MKQTLGIFMLLCALSFPLFSFAAVSTTPDRIATLQALVAQLQALLAQLQTLQNTGTTAKEVTDGGLTIEYTDAIKGPSYTGSGFTKGQFVLIVDVTAINESDDTVTLLTSDFTVSDVAGHRFYALRQSEVGGQPRFKNMTHAPTSGRSALRDATIPEGDRFAGSLEFYVPLPAVREFIISYKGTKRTLYLTDESNHN